MLVGIKIGSFRKFSLILSSGFLGVGQPTVPVGENVYTVLTTGATVSTPGKGESVAESTGAIFCLHTGTEKGTSFSFFWNLEDQYSLSGSGSGTSAESPIIIVFQVGLHPLERFGWSLRIGSDTTF